MRYSKIFLALILIFFLIFFACQKGRKNPLDLDNKDTKGNPFNLRVNIEGNAIRLNWDLVSHPEIAGYYIYRGQNTVAYIQKLATLNEPTNSYLDINVDRGNTYYYRVTTFNKDNAESDLSSSPVAYIHNTPKFEINDNSPFSASSSVKLTITADKGDSMLISNSSDFSGASWQKISGWINNWQLPSGEGTQSVYLKVRYSDGQVSDRVKDTIIVDFHPPVAVFSITPADSAHISAKFDAALSSDNLCPHNLLNYRWRWQADTSYSNWISIDTLRHVFPTVGLKTITLQVRDQAGRMDSISHNLLVYNNPPLPAFNPSPAVGDTADTSSIVIKWKGQDPDNDNLHYDIYLDTLNPPQYLLAARQYLDSLRIYQDLYRLANHKHYYWKVVSFDFYEAATDSPVWNFYTEW